MFKKLNVFFDKKTYWVQLFLLCVLIVGPKIIAWIILAVALFFVEIPDFTDIPGLLAWESGGLSLVYAPLLETLIFQLFVIQLMDKVRYLRQRPLLILFGAAILFGLMHFEYPSKMIFSTYPGLILAFSYYYYYKNGKKAKAYWTTAFIHFLHNLIALFAGDYLKALQ